MSDKDDKAQDAITPPKTIAPGETFDENFGADELPSADARRLAESDDERAARIASLFGLSELQYDEREFLERVGWARSSRSRPIRDDATIAEGNAPAPEGDKPTPDSGEQYRREHSDEDGVLTINLDETKMTHEEEMALYEDVPRAPRAPKDGP